MSRLFINKIYLILFYLLFSNFSFGQHTELLKEKGLEKMNMGNYAEAIPYFEEAISIDSSLLNLHYNYAYSLMMIHKYDQSITEFKKVTVLDPSGKKHPKASFYLAQIQDLKGEYKDALTNWKKTKANFSKQPEGYIYKKSVREINSNIFAIRHKNIVKSNTKIAHLNQLVNGDNADFAGFEKNNNFYYSSFKAKDNHSVIFKSENNLMSPLDSTVNDPIHHNANGTFTEDGKHFLFSRCDNYNQCFIMHSKFNGKSWSNPVKIGREVNKTNFNATHPNISKLNGKMVLFFSANYSFGNGKMDLWYAPMYDDITFGNAVNLGKKINSIDDEITPFFHQASQNLYFSSKWHNNFGGYDVFSSHWNGANFEKPVNLEKPINSSWNDIYFWMSENAEYGYLTSNRDGANFDSIPHCCSDIWKFKSSKPIAIKKKTNTKEVFKKKTGITLPLALYFHNDQPSPKSLDTVVNQTYPETYYDYINLKKTYVNEYTRSVKNNEKKLAENEINAFFNDYVTGGIDRLTLFKKQLKPLLREYETVEITIKGFASPLAKSDYNTNLSKRRISSLINYFKSADNQYFKEYINNGKLIINAAPFGEVKANSNASDDLKNTRKSIFSPQAAMERRIEIQEVIFK